ncbi:MAG TPA: SDR family oxidoreductase [Candidatus Eremiobacteraceae bacterium]
MRLNNKVAIITGGDTGIGKAISLELACEGASVVIDYHGDAGPANALVERINNLGYKAVAISADVTRPPDVESLVEATAKAFGGIDILVNNAGIEEQHPFLEMPFEVYAKVIGVNLTGNWLCSQAAARQMVKQNRGGRIINISSVHEDVAMPTNAPYCASKGALRMLMRTIAIELAQYHITVNNIAPGAVETPMDAELERDPKELARLLAEIPMRRMGRPQEIAGLVAYLASDAAAYITGATYVIDGGMSKWSGSL